MTDLDAAIRARLDDWVENALDPQAAAAAAALTAVLDMHKQAEPGLFVAKGPKCQHCYGEIGDVEEECGDWPCATVFVIAEKLGVKHEHN